MLTLHSLTVYMHSIGIGNVHYFGSNLQTCHPILLLKDPYLPSSFVDCSLCFFAVAGLKHDLQALRDQLAEMRQQAGAPTLVPPSAVCVPPSTCSHTVLPAIAMSHEGSPTQAHSRNSSSSTGNKRGFALSGSSPFGIMASAFGGGRNSSPTAERAAPLAAAMSTGTASPAVALAGFGSPIARRPPLIAAATTGRDLEAAPGVLSTAASGPQAAAQPPHAPAPLATDTPAAVRGGGGLVVPIAVAPSPSLTPDDAPVSGEPAFDSAVPPSAVSVMSGVVATAATAGLAESPAPFGSPVASSAPTTAVANSGADLGVITATTCASTATPGCSATTAAMPAAAVYGNERAEPAVPQTTTPEEPRPIAMLQRSRTFGDDNHFPPLVAAQLGDAVQCMPAKVAYDVPVMHIILKNPCQCQPCVMSADVCVADNYLLFL